MIQPKDVQKERDYYVRLIRRIVAETTECQAVYSQLLPVLGAMADLLEAGCLTELYRVILDLDVRTAGSGRNRGLYDCHRQLFVKLRMIERAVTGGVDPELKTLVRGLLVVRRMLVITLGRTTLLPDQQTLVSLPVFAHTAVMAATKTIMAEHAKTESFFRAIA